MTYDSKSMNSQDTIRLRADPFGRGRKFDAHELDLMLASLLKQGSRHGYQLRKELARLSKGFYEPSSGVLYPALARLEADGHASVRAQGNRKYYQLTPQGKAFLEAHQAETDHLFAVLAHAARKMVWLRQAEVDEHLASAETGWLPEFVAIRRELKQMMLTHSDASFAQQRRVVTILKRALNEIRASETDQE